MSQELTLEQSTEQSTDESPAEGAAPEGIEPAEQPTGELDQGESEQPTEG